MNYANQTVTQPFSTDHESCVKCGSEDIGLKYRRPGDNGFLQEHLLYECNDCDFTWRTLTKDAV